MKQVPFQYFFLGIFVILLIVIIFSRPNLHQLFDAVNSIGENPMALIVIIIGCIMLIESKSYGIDDGLAGGLITLGGYMLRSQLQTAATKKLEALPPVTGPTPSPAPEVPATPLPASDKEAPKE